MTVVDSVVIVVYHLVKGKGKCKGQVLAIALLYESDSRPEALLQSRKWQLTGMS